MHIHIRSLDELYNNCRIISKASDEGKRLWRSALVKFVENLRITDPNIKIFVVDARFTLRVRNMNGAIVEHEPQMKNWIQFANSMLDFMVTNFRDAVPECAVLKAPEELEISDAAHRWGLQPFHYIDEWYACIRNQILASIDQA